MKILVTGGAGFIGSHVIRLALKQGHSIVNLDSLTYAACLENLSDVENNPKYTFEQCDILDRDRLKTLFKNHIPDAVMHLAAESHVDRSIDGPEKFIQTNVNGTFNLLEEALTFWHAQGNPEKFRFHHVSTDEVFGSLGKIGAFSEDTPYDPRSPYSASKASSDHLVRAWHETYSLPTIITNCSNNYGPFHFPEKLIPLMILNALAGKALPIYGTGMNVRDWLFVEDHAKALLLVLEKGLPGRNYNIGGENERTNIDLVTALCKILDRLKPRQSGSYAELITFVSDRPGHDQRYAIDPTRIRSELGWSPSTSLEKGLEITVKWYLANEDWWRPLLSRGSVENRLGLRELN